MFSCTASRASRETDFARWTILLNAPSTVSSSRLMSTWMVIISEESDIISEPISILLTVSLMWSRWLGFSLPDFGRTFIVLNPRKYSDMSRRATVSGLSPAPISTVAVSNCAVLGWTSGGVSIRLVDPFFDMRIWSPRVRPNSSIHFFGSDMMYDDLPVNWIFLVSYFSSMACWPTYINIHYM